jgi:hypothetical protein
MRILLNGSPVLSFNYPSDYEGKPYQFVAPNGTVFPVRNITAGDVIYP